MSKRSRFCFIVLDETHRLSSIVYQGKSLVFMDTALSLARQFIVGMGHVIGITPAVPQPQYKCNEYGVIGGDFLAVGNDLRMVMRKYPPTPDTARQLGQSVQQLELSVMAGTK